MPTCACILTHVRRAPGIGLPTITTVITRRPVFCKPFSGFSNDSQDVIKTEKNHITVNAGRGSSRIVQIDVCPANGETVASIEEKDLIDVQVASKKAEYRAQYIDKATEKGIRATMERGGIWSVHYFPESEAEEAKEKLAAVSDLPVPEVDYYIPATYVGN